MVEVLIKCMEWNMSSRRRGIRSEGSEGLTAIHQRAVDLLELLKGNLPDKCGEKGGLNIDKAHSILHKVREIIMWGNSDNRSCQSAEHAHIDLIKAVAGCTINKDVFMCILRFHARRAYLQHYQALLQELNDCHRETEFSSQSEPESVDSYAHEHALLRDRNFNVAGETGVRYPSYEVMSKRETMCIRISVSLSYLWIISCSSLDISDNSLDIP
jgi:hypothetical protein